MVILKEHEAACYLDRAAGCINPEDNFSNLQLVKKMLEIEAAFLRRIALTNPDLAKISVDASGFPELIEWWGDIVCAFKEYDLVRSQRNKLLQEPFRQFLNANPQGIVEASGKVSQELTDDTAFMEVFADLTPEQRSYLVSLETSGVVSKSDKFPRLISVTHSESPFQPMNFVPDAPKIEYPGHYIDSVQNMILTPKVSASNYLKFIDHSQKPFIGYITDSTVRILIGGFPLLQRCGKRLIRAIKRDEYDHRKTCCVYYKGEKSFNMWALYDAYCPDVSLLPEDPHELESIINNLQPKVREELLNLETAKLAREGVDRLINLLPELDKLSKDAFTFWESTIKGTISNENFSIQSHEYAQKIEAFFNGIEDEGLRMPLQLAFAEVLSPFKKDLDLGISLVKVDPRQEIQPALPAIAIVHDTEVPPKRKWWPFS